MANFGKSLAQYLANELEIPLRDVTTALDNFGDVNSKEGQTERINEEKPSTKSEKVTTNTTNTTKTLKEVTKPAPKKTVTTSKPTEQHTCERKKKGQSDP